jgi:hypothetical protein
LRFLGLRLSCTLYPCFLVGCLVPCYPFTAVVLVGLWVGWYGLALALVW